MHGILKNPTTRKLWRGKFEGPKVALDLCDLDISPYRNAGYLPSRCDTPCVSTSEYTSYSKIQKSYNPRILLRDLDIAIKRVILWILARFQQYFRLTQYYRPRRCSSPIRRVTGISSS